LITSSLLVPIKFISNYYQETSHHGFRKLWDSYNLTFLLLIIISAILSLLRDEYNSILTNILQYLLVLCFAFTLYSTNLYLAKKRGTFDASDSTRQIMADQVSELMYLANSIIHPAIIIYILSIADNELHQNGFTIIQVILIGIYLIASLILRKAHQNLLVDEK